jgi:hypothetical protein
MSFVSDKKPMMSRSTQYAWSFAIAFALSLLMLVFPILGFREAGYLLWPGLMVGAILFPQGVHGDLPGLYLIVAFFLSVFIYSWVVFGVWLLIEHARRRN